MRGVTGSGQAPVDELLAGRADFVVGDSPLEPIFKNALQDHVLHSRGLLEVGHNPVPIGHAIAKNQPVFLEFLQRRREEGRCAR